MNRFKFFFAFLFELLTLASLLFSPILWGQAVFAHNNGRSLPFFTETSNLPSESQGVVIAKAIRKAGPIADAAQLMGISFADMMSQLGEDPNDVPKFFLIATIRKSPFGEPLRNQFRTGDRIIVGLSPKQINEQLLNNPEYRVMNMTEADALMQSGQLPNNPTRACDPAHNQGDMANRWCHAAIADTINQYFLQMGLNPILSAVFGAIPILIKEYFVDLHPSKSDMVLGELLIWRSNAVRPNEESFLYFTGFADGAFFLTYKGKFRGI